MITIGQLAAYVGVSIKTIRVYHDKGLLPEPDRDASGYRRYDAGDVIDLIKIRTLAEAGVPLARIRELRSATVGEFRQALHGIDEEITARIRDLRATQERLRRLAAGQPASVPAEVAAHLERLAGWGFTPRWVDLQRDLWILVFATHPDHANTLFRDQAESLADPVLRQLFLTTQYLEEADELADLIAVLNDGKIVAEGTAEELKRILPGGHVWLRFTDPTAYRSAADALREVTRDDQALSLSIPSDGSQRELRSILDWLDSAGVEADELTVHTPDLDDVFFALTGGGNIPDQPRKDAR
ncbi:MerR family DNA-binding transcriptional regulator [Streptomyces sp. NPDC033754]|uniref:MerR family DNA-binding transcriptional regulator n=1 Tax=unclassified Streptomyces TaxID=2593676 RepID=UPI00340AC3B7